MKKKILFIINPISGVQKKAKLPELIEQNLDLSKFEYTLKYTERAGHATFIAKDAVVEGYDIVVAVGGDGSINEVAESLIDTEVVLGIIPMGSGNGFATHLKLPLRNAKKAILALNGCRVEKIDVGMTNYGSFISCAGIGLEAAVARTYRHHSVRGFFSYTLAMHKEILASYRSKNNRVKFYLDGVEREENIYLFTAFNSKYFGYNQGFATKASLQDGLFDVVFVKSVPTWKMPFLILLGLIKKVHWLKEAEFHSVRKIEIVSEGKRIIQVDGDSLMTSQNFVMEIKDKALNLLVPISLKKL
jgi:diacylglycerol kinase (ATP)